MLNPEAAAPSVPPAGQPYRACGTQFFHTFTAVGEEHIQQDSWSPGEVSFVLTKHTYIKFLSGFPGLNVVDWKHFGAF